MMKQIKKNDGYVLVYVLIVFVILSLAAVSISTIALKNLQTQEAAVDRTRALYQAEGLVEQFVVQVGALRSTSDLMNPETVIYEDGTDVTQKKQDAQDAVKQAARDNFLEEAEAINGIAGLTLDVGNSTADKLIFEVDTGVVRIDVALSVNLGFALNESTTDLEPSETQVQYSCSAEVNSVQLTYLSYDISYEGGAA